MNKIILIGRITRNIEVRQTQAAEPVSVCKFSLAVDRRGANAPADFPSCIAFGNNADNIAKYFGKGKKIAIEGRLQTGNYTDKDGKKIYTTDVYVESWEFVESKSDGSQANETTEGIDDLPFK